MNRSHQHLRVITAVAVLILSLIHPTPGNAANATLQNISPRHHNAPAGTSLPDLAEAIKAGGRALHWEVQGESPGMVELRVHIRSHEASVMVGYDESKYWIDYLDSVDLDYRPNDWRTLDGMGILPGRATIHRNYNIWVAELSKAIRSSCRYPPKGLADNEVSENQPILLADELEKLDALRQRGILTQKEFDQAKRKVLAQ
jgi:hypothetical protein